MLIYSTSAFGPWLCLDTYTQKSQYGDSEATHGEHEQEVIQVIIDSRMLFIIIIHYLYYGCADHCV